METPLHYLHQTKMLTLRTERKSMSEVRTNLTQLSVCMYIMYERRVLHEKSLQVFHSEPVPPPSFKNTPFTGLFLFQICI